MLPVQRNRHWKVEKEKRVITAKHIWEHWFRHIELFPRHVDVWLTPAMLQKIIIFYHFWQLKLCIFKRVKACRLLIVGSAETALRANWEDRGRTMYCHYIAGVQTTIVVMIICFCEHIGNLVAFFKGEEKQLRKLNKSVACKQCPETRMVYACLNVQMWWKCCQKCVV